MNSARTLPPEYRPEQQGVGRDGHAGVVLAKEASEIVVPERIAMKWHELDSETTYLPIAGLQRKGILQGLGATSQFAVVGVM